MPNGPFESRLRLLSSAFHYAGQPLSFGRAELYPDRIRLAPWGTGRRNPVTIPIEEIVSVDWPADESDGTALRLKDGSVVLVRLGKHDIWRRYLESRLAWRDRKAGAALPEKPDWTIRDIIHYTGSMS
jgi:hypothetical protein